LAGAITSCAAGKGRSLFFPIIGKRGKKEKMVRCTPSNGVLSKTEGEGSCFTNITPLVTKKRNPYQLTTKKKGRIFTVPIKKGRCKKVQGPFG